MAQQPIQPAGPAQWCAVGLLLGPVGFFGLPWLFNLIFGG